MGFVLVVGLFVGVRGLASPEGGARGGGGGNSVNGGSGTDGGGTGTTGAGGNGGSGSDGGGGTTGGTWQTGGSDGDGNGSGDGGKDGDGDGDKSGNGSGNGNGGGQPPGWLPWGPKSPNTDTEPEPDSVYDDLQTGKCHEPYEIATDPAEQTGGGSPGSWKVIEGLAGICKAARGESDGMDIATKADAWLRASNYRPGGAGQLCKDGDALGVLRRFVAYYRQHPRERVALRAAPSGSRACESHLAVTDGRVEPGGTISLHGTWPDSPATVELRAAELTEPVVLEPIGDPEDPSKCCKDAGFAVDLPGGDGFGGRRPTSVDVTLVTRSGARLVKEAAFTIDWTGIAPSPPPGPSGPSPSISGRTSSPGSSPVPSLLSVPSLPSLPFMASMTSNATSR
ncbi:hypothetical protein [Streptomyces sp. NPDC003032]